MRKSRITFEHCVDWYLGIPFRNKFNPNPRYNTYKWTKSVYTRDNYTCQICETKQDIQAHHIRAWKKYPDYRYNIDNGIVLCRNCHQNVHRLRPV